MPRYSVNTDILYLFYFLLSAGGRGTTLGTIIRLFGEIETNGCYLLEEEWKGDFKGGEWDGIGDRSET